MDLRFACFKAFHAPDFLKWLARFLKWRGGAPFQEILEMGGVPFQEILEMVLEILEMAGGVFEGIWGAGTC